MSQASRGEGALGKRELYRLIAEESMRDGVLDEEEKAILKKMGRFLKLENELARGIVLEARERFRRGELGERRAMDPEKLYALVREAVLADGEVDELEAKMLRGLRLVLGVREEAAGEEGGAVEAARSGEDPGLELPSSEQLFRLRAAEDPLELWARKQHLFTSAVEAACPKARRISERLRSGVVLHDAERACSAMQWFRKLVETGTGLTVSDYLVGLDAIRWSRMLLQTVAVQGADGRWERRCGGASVYRALGGEICETLDLLDGKSLPKGVYERFAAELVHPMLFVGLLEDLALLVEARGADLMETAGAVLGRVMAHVEDAELQRAGARVLEILHRRVESLQREDMTDSWMGLLGELSERGGAGLAMAAVAKRLVAGGPEQDLSVLMEPASVASAGSEDLILMRLASLAEEMRHETVAARLLVRALERRDLSVVDDFIARMEDGARAEGREAVELLDKTLYVLPLYDLEGYPRPVIAVFSFGAAELHLEEFKGQQVLLDCRLHENGRLMPQPRCRAVESSIFAGRTLEPDELPAFREALARVDGAFDVALVDPDRRRLRVWFQRGDIDPTGLCRGLRERVGSTDHLPDFANLIEAVDRLAPWSTLHRVVEADHYQRGTGDLHEALQVLDEALERAPFSPSLLEDRGVVLLQQGEVDAGLDALALAQRQTMSYVTIINSVNFFHELMKRGRQGLLHRSDFQVAALFALFPDHPFFGGPIAWKEHGAMVLAPVYPAHYRAYF